MGPHFDRQQAQRTTYDRASEVSKHLRKELITEDYLSLFKFLSRKKQKAKYRDSSSKKTSFGKDISSKEWTAEKNDRFDEDLIFALDTGVVSNFLKESLLAVLEEDLKIFTAFSDSRSHQVSTDVLKNLAKRYELFFVSSDTFEEVKKCRELALAFSRSPYVSEKLDQSRKQYSKDLEIVTDWEFRNCWPWVDEVLQRGIEVRVVTGAQDPFATGGDFTECLRRNSRFVDHVIDHVGHSPIYEKPEMTFKLLESLLYGK